MIVFARDSISVWHDSHIDLKELMAIKCDPINNMNANDIAE